MSDLDAADDIRKDGMKFIALTGSSQWQHNHPSREILKKDIETGSLYGLYLDGELCLICALFFVPDRSYEVIEGKFLTDSRNYLSIHTFAVKGTKRGQHLHDKMFAYAKKLVMDTGMDSIRADTYKKNSIMQHVFAKEGFTYCGNIHLLDEVVDNDRMAYEWVNPKKAR